MRSVESKTTLLAAPPLDNFTCSPSRPPALTALGLTQAFFIATLSLSILVANLLVITVINSRRYSKYIHSQPRYLLTSLASNDLAIGVFITPFGFLSAFFDCWMNGDIVCQIQAILRGALTQQSAMLLIIMAIDRYICMLHPFKYHKHWSKKWCMFFISLTLVFSLVTFSLMVLQRGGYYYNASGLLACDPFYSRPSFRILAACLFYFPTTMLLMYCYGSAFHVNKLRLSTVVNSVIGPGHGPHGQPSDAALTDAAIEKMLAQERRMSMNTSRTMAAMSLGFIVVVTPWTIQEVVAACTGSKMPAVLDFFITWLALSNSFWNPFLYWLLNNNFRRIGRELFFKNILCRSEKKRKSAEALPRCCSNGFISTMTSSGASREAQAQAQAQLHHNRDLEGLSEKYWGEILERTVSCSSLQTLQRVYPPPPPPKSKPPPGESFYFLNDC
nr:PREDICTED: trace amine-associated receptor 8c [Bemisia tabaci]